MSDSDITSAGALHARSLHPNLVKTEFSCDSPSADEILDAEKPGFLASGFCLRHRCGRYNRLLLLLLR